MRFTNGYIKKSLALLLAVLMMVALAACQKDQADEPAQNGDPYEIAMISDGGALEDGSFNQGIWSGITAFSEKQKVDCQFYNPSEISEAAYADTIKKAVNNGANVVVAAGYRLEKPIYAAQSVYPDITFIMVDGVPQDEDAGKSDLLENTAAVIYAEEQAGYLAGYAAVKDGYTKLGFVGSMKSPTVTCYGYGFAQGADAAAKEAGVPEVELKFTYTGSYDQTPETEALAKEWFSDGTEVIFGCGGSLGKSIVSAAERVGGKVIQVDIDHAGESETILTSAMKNLKGSMEMVLESYYDGAFPGGEILNFDASNDGVMLPMETSRFQQFSQADYDALYEKLASGIIDLKKDDIAVPYELGLETVRVVMVE